MWELPGFVSVSCRTRAPLAVRMSFDAGVEVDGGAVDPKVVQVGVEEVDAVQAADVVDPGPVIDLEPPLGGLAVDAFQLHALCHASRSWQGLILI
jgi:hypothetical protein